MNKAQYIAITAPFRKTAARKKFLQITDAVLTGIVYLAYPALLLGLLLTRDARLWRCFFVPFLSFTAVSLLRKRINADRPYTVFELEPVLSKEKSGESFPSRHIFSVFVIACAFGTVRPVLGLILGALGVLLAVVRVVGGVHFPKDVLAGAAIGLGCGIFGFYLF